MPYSNSQILAAVLTEWARPAISQVASSNLMRLPSMQSLQNMIGSLGIVSGKYALQGDIEPLIAPVVNAIVAPVLMRYFANVPDESIPKMAHDIVEQFRDKGSVSILEGFVTFDKEDIDELAMLLEKNLPVTEEETYQVKH